MIRLAFTILTACVAGLALAPFAILAWPLKRDGAVGFWVARFCAHLVLKAARVTTSVEFAAPLPDGPVVFVSNHVSVLDIPLVFATLPRPFRIVYKRSLLFTPVLGQFLAASRHIPIDRSRAFRAKRSLEKAARRIHNGVSVALFPEGTRSGQAPMGPFKLGSFKLAVQADVPVVPVSLIGLRQVMLPGRRLRPGHIRIRIHEALVPRSGDDAAAGLSALAEATIRGEVEK